MAMALLPRVGEETIGEVNGILLTSRRDVDASTRDAYTHLMHHAVPDIPLAAVNPVDLAFESTPLLILNGPLFPAADAAAAAAAATNSSAAGSTTPSPIPPATPPPPVASAAAASAGSTPVSPSTPLTPSTPPSAAAGGGDGAGGGGAQKAATPHSPSVVASGGRSGGEGGGGRGSRGSLGGAAADVVLRLQHMLPAFLASSPPPPPPSRPLIAWHRFSPRLLASGPLDRLLLFDLQPSALQSGPPPSPSPPAILLHELQRHVSCVDWRPKAGATLAVACRAGICLWSLTGPLLVEGPSGGGSALSGITGLQRHTRRQLCSYGTSPQAWPLPCGVASQE
ncbi:hypothetical protein CLOP_g20855 [Closterium sp. NIES-67]|nr:hypothetical protein CLOP_g20855 [Closterium sp. NIES-67]